MAASKDAKNAHQLIAEVIDSIQRFGGLAWRCNSGTLQQQNREGKTRFVHFGAKGMEDVQGLLCSCFLAVEIKAPGDNPTDVQLERLSQVYDKGGLPFILRETNLAYFQNMLEECRGGDFTGAQLISEAALNEEKDNFAKRRDAAMERAAKKQRRQYAEHSKQPA